MDCSQLILTVRPRPLQLSVRGMFSKIPRTLLFVVLNSIVKDHDVEIVLSSDESWSIAECF